LKLRYEKFERGKGKIERVSLTTKSLTPSFRSAGRKKAGKKRLKQGGRRGDTRVLGGGMAGPIPKRNGISGYFDRLSGKE